MRIHLVITACALAVSGLALAKLPPPPALDDAAKAKAAETAAKAAWQAKVDTWQLCKAQDRVAANYRKNAAMKPATLTPVSAPAAAAMPAAPVAAPAAAAPAAAAPVTPSNSANPTTASQGGGTPVALAPAAAAGCPDPGPFAYNLPSQTPLETSGAHSPAGTAVSPPSVKQPSAEMAPAKPATAASKKP